MVGGGGEGQGVQFVHYDNSKKMEILSRLSNLCKKFIKFATSGVLLMDTTIIFKDNISTQDIKKTKVLAVSKRIISYNVFEIIFLVKRMIHHDLLTSDKNLRDYYLEYY